MEPVDLLEGFSGFYEIKDADVKARCQQELQTVCPLEQNAVCYKCSRLDHISTDKSKTDYGHKKAEPSVGCYILLQWMKEKQETEQKAGT